MTFGSGDNDFHHFSDHLCCCGIPNTIEFKNIYNGHLGYGIYNALRTGKVSFDYIQKFWHPVGSIKRYINSDCRINGSCNIIELLKSKINKPDSSNSPRSFYGVNYSSNNQYTISNKVMKEFHELGGSHGHI